MIMASYFIQCKTISCRQNNYYVTFHYTFTADKKITWMMNEGPYSRKLQWPISWWHSFERTEPDLIYLSSTQSRLILTQPWVRVPSTRLLYAFWPHGRFVPCMLDAKLAVQELIYDMDSESSPLETRSRLPLSHQMMYSQCPRFQTQ